MIEKLTPHTDITILADLLNKSFRTIADEFGLTKDNCPSNNSFIDEASLKNQIDRGMDIYILFADKVAIGCVAIERSSQNPETFYIEKLAVLPEFRHHGYGQQLMNFASSEIKRSGGRTISVSLIDSNTKLKEWYSALGYTETCCKDYDHLPFRVCFMSKQI